METFINCSFFQSSVQTISSTCGIAYGLETDVQAVFQFDEYVA